MKQENYSSSKSIFKLIANILSWTALVILILVAIFLLYLTISSKIYAKKGAAYEPKFSLYTIISPSMHPNLRVYDIIVDQRVDSPNDIKIGDVITFISTSSISSNKTVTHRVIDIIIDEKGNYQYQTKGDNNLSADSAYAEYNNILGKVLFKIPQLGRVQFFLASRGGWLVAIVIPALYIIIKDILKIFKLTKINKKAETVVEDKKAEDDEKRKKRQAEEEERKRKIKEKMHKITDDNSETHVFSEDNDDSDIKLFEKEEKIEADINIDNVEEKSLETSETEYKENFVLESDESEEAEDNLSDNIEMEEKKQNNEVINTEVNELVNTENAYISNDLDNEPEAWEMPKLKTEKSDVKADETTENDSVTTLNGEKRTADMYEEIFSHVPKDNNKPNQEANKNNGQKDINAAQKNKYNNHNKYKNSKKKKNNNKKHNHNKHHK